MTDKQTEHDSGARPVALRLDDIAPLLIAWQRTREAIGSVEVAQPTQISSAMEQLLAARIEMERSVNALLQWFRANA